MAVTGADSFARTRDRTHAREEGRERQLVTTVSEREGCENKMYTVLASGNSMEKKGSSEVSLLRFPLCLVLLLELDLLRLFRQPPNVALG